MKYNKIVIQRHHWQISLFANCCCASCKFLKYFECPRYSCSLKHSFSTCYDIRKRTIIIPLEYPMYNKPLLAQKLSHNFCLTLWRIYVFLSMYDLWRLEWYSQANRVISFQKLFILVLKKKSQNVQCDTGKERSSFRCLRNIEYKCSLKNYKKVKNACSIRKSP